MGSNMPSPPLAQPSSWPRPRANIATVRKRADKACQPCRARKVRCNITDNGEPCNNCCMRGVTCVPSGNRPSRKKPQGAMKSLSWINKHPQVSSGAAKESDRKRPDITDTSFRLWTEMDDGSEELGDEHEIQGDDSSGTISNLVKTVSMHGDRTATRLDESAGDLGKYLTTAPLPPYIKPPPKSMTAEDTKFLWAKGALSIPHTTFRNELIRCYIEFVHPELPLIELHDFLRLIDGSGDQGSISLVLFQAILFAGTAFVDQSALQEAGYSTRREVRTAFYHRARLLYDFDYEDDRIALLQSLLLMTLYCENPDNQKDGWHWIGVAISFAHTLGIHRNLETSVADVKKLRLYRRLWWCCIMRDRLLSLGMRRPARIDDEDFNLSMLTVEDFEIKSLGGDEINIALDCVIISDTSMQTHMAMLFIAKARLCLCINHVLAAQYSAHVEDHGVEARLMLIPKRSSQSQISSCDFELTDWFRSLPSPCRYTTPTTQDFSAPVVQRAILYMLYFSTISTLHRPRALPTGPSSYPADLQEISRWKIRDASNEITKIMLDLHRLNLTRYLPTTGVTVLLPAIVIHLLDSNSSSIEAREAGQNGLAQCMDVLQQLRDKYAPADDAIQFLEGALRRSNIDLRILNVMEKIAAQGVDGSSLQSQQTVHSSNLELQYPQLNHNSSEPTSPLHQMAWEALEDDNDYDLQSTATSTENGSESYDPAPDIDQSLSTGPFSPLVGIDNADFDYVFQALVNFNGEANIMEAE